MAEYGLIIALVVVVVIVGVTAFGVNLLGYWDALGDTITDAII